jgi:UDPglucose--hexose-1-phosphate uridylyltransferase
MEFKFIENKSSNVCVISAVRRAKRPNIAKGVEPVCPFCPGSGEKEPEVYRIGGRGNDSNWKVRVVNNKFPFAPIHEVVIHSPDHEKSFAEFPIFQTELVLQTYLDRYNEHRDKGWVYIFHNHGIGGGESLPHPHSQIAVIPEEVAMNIQHLEGPSEKEEVQETEKFTIFCPLYSQWPEEIWMYPKERGGTFGETTKEELHDLAKILHRLVQIMDLRHNNEFPYNFYIYPGYDWYLRIVPRFKTLGGFEIGTGIFINTQDPRETIKFIKTHFDSPNEELIRTKHQANYRRGA